MGAWSEGDADHVAARVDAEDLGGDSARNGDVNGGKGAPLLPPVDVEAGDLRTSSTVHPEFIDAHLKGLLVEKHVACGAMPHPPELRVDLNRRIISVRAKGTENRPA